MFRLKNPFNKNHSSARKNLICLIGMSLIAILAVRLNQFLKLDLFRGTALAFSFEALWLSFLGLIGYIGD